MLILVGVTVNVALNGGLFETANKAVKQTQKEADREILQAAVIAALNEQLIIENANAILKNLPDGWDVTGADGGPYTCTSPKGNVFIVDQNGEITIAWVDNGDGTFTKGDTTVEIGKTYTNAEFEELLKKLGIIEEYTGAYTGDWQLIGIQGDKLKLVSTKNVSDNVILGYADPNVYKTDKAGKPILDAEGNKILKDEIEDLNGDRDLVFEKAVWSYAHAVDTLDEVAQKATGITSARSITIEDIYDIIGKAPWNGAVYNYFFDTTNSKVCSKKRIIDENGEEKWENAHITNFTDMTFVDSEGKIVTIDAKHPNASVTLKNDRTYLSLAEDETVLRSIALVSDEYWLASPYVECESRIALFGVLYVYRDTYSCKVGGYELFGRPMSMQEARSPRCGFYLIILGTGQKII